MANFYDISVWRGLLLFGLLFVSLLIANVLKTQVPFLKKSLIPNSVLGGMLMLIISSVVYFTTGDYLFNQPVFSTNGSGIATLEVVTYHCLAIGFIAMTLRPSGRKLTKERTGEIFNSGLTTVNSYLLQATFGLVVTFICTVIIADFAGGSGILLCFGYGQGTGQALNIGGNFDASMGTTGIYKNIGLSLAAIGFLVASIVGVIVINIWRKKGKLAYKEATVSTLKTEDVVGANEPPINESVDKLSIQFALIILSYLVAYGMMYLLGNVILKGGNMLGTVYGFNFLFGVLSATLVKSVLKLLKKGGLLKKDYVNTFLLNRVSGFAFDLMIVAGICAIQIDLVSGYIVPIVIMAVLGAAVTFLYVNFICKKLFPDYRYEQFLAFFGMLTGTASTGMILLREADPNLESPVSENLVYQNLPAIVFGFPIMLIASSFTTHPRDMGNNLLLFGIIIGIFVVLNVVLFRKFIFKKRKSK